MSAPPVVTAIMRGLAGHCPACGEGRMFAKYLKVADACEACGEQLYHHRADDFPAYIVVSIVGHIMLSAAYWIEVSFAPAIWLQMVSLLPAGAAMTLALLQPVKGAVVAVQWHIGMDGFGISKAARVGAN